MGLVSINSDDPPALSSGGEAIPCELSGPAGLRVKHSTKAGVWARIVVLEGSLPFRFLEPHDELVVLTPEQPGIVAPTQLHRAEPGPGVRFYVEFHRAEAPLTPPGPPPQPGGA